MLSSLCVSSTPQKKWSQQGSIVSMMERLSHQFGRFKRSRKWMVQFHRVLKIPARALHARKGKRENSGPAASSRQNSQPSANVGAGPVVGCMSFVSSSVIDAAKVRCAEHERSVHQRDCQPYSAERCKIGGASLALCAASILTKSTHWSDQRPPVSHASVSSLTLPRACHASLYCVGLRFSPLSIAPPGTVHAFGCGEPSTLRGEP